MVCFLAFAICFFGYHHQAPLGIYGNAAGFTAWHETPAIHRQAPSTNIGDAVACASPTPPCIPIVLH